MKDLYKKISFVQNVLECFTDYSNNLDKYFEKEENKNNHKELYDYYVKLRNDLVDLKKRKF